MEEMAAEVNAAQRVFKLICIMSGKEPHNHNGLADG